LCCSADIVVRVGEELNKALEECRKMRNEFQVGDRVEDCDPVYEEHPGKRIEGEYSLSKERNETWE
jgi:hypothetical protein